MVVGLDLDRLVIELEEWIKTQPQLPQSIEKTLLKRFLFSMFGDVNGAKRLVEINYTLRNKYPQIFLNRDPDDESSRQLLQVADLVPLPGLTPKKNKLIFYRLVDFDAEKFDLTAGVKVFFMLADCRFSFEDREGMSEGEIPIFDMSGYSLRHLRKTVLSSLRIYMKFVQEAHPVRLKEIHVLNCPSYLDKVLMIIKPFIKSDVFKLIHFHLPNAETPFEYFPREMLPEEYGGKAGKMAHLKEEWLKILKEKRDYLTNSKYWRMDSTRKPIISNQTKDFTQSFKTLEID